MKSLFNAIRRLNFRRGPQRVLGGIAGGIAYSADLNVWLARLLVLLSFLLPGIGIILYVIVWLLTPWQDHSIPLERAIFGNRPR